MNTRHYDGLVIGSGPGGEGAAMILAKGANTLAYFVQTNFNYATMAEAYRVATLNGLNRVF